MNLSKSRLTIGLLTLFAFAGILQAQTYPMPWKSGGTPQKCTGCPGINLFSQPNDGLPTYPFSAPITRHVGRVVDSTITQDYQNVGMRTARAKKVLIAEDRRGNAPARVYQQLGSTLAVYSLGTYLTTTLARPMEQVSVFKTGWSFTAHQPQEMVHTPDAFVYAEGKSSGWETETVDGQDRLLDFDYDDRGYIYLAYTIFGWGIVKDAGETSGVMLEKVAQIRNDVTVPGPSTIGVIRAGAKYYAIVSDRLAGTDRLAGVVIFDVTDPRNPVRGRSASGKVNRIDRMVRDDASSRVLILNGDGVIRIYDNATFANGGAPITTIAPPTGKVWTDVAAGSDAFWAIESKSNFSPTSSTIAKITESGSSYAVDYINPYGGLFAAQYLGVHDRYLAVMGNDGGALDARLFKITSGGLELIDTGGYFQKYYHNAPSGYAMPAQNVNSGGIQPLKYDGKLFLMYNVRGLADVYEIQAGDSVSASQSGNSFGTRNPNSKTSDGPYYGDILKFSATTTNAFGFPVTWEFGNPEAGSANSVASRTGDVVQHQWAGLNTVATITSPKTVKVWVGADDSISDALSVTMLKPVARVGVQDTNVSVTSGTTGLSVVAGENFTDGSDGVVQGHVATWTIDGALTNRTPDAVQPVGTVGPHTLKFVATYGPYTPDFVPTVLPAYQTAVDNVSYTVLPFMASISAPVKGASGVTFTGVGRLAKQAGIITSQTWTVTWSIQNAAGADIVPPQVTGEALGTITPFVVAPTITNGSVVKLKVDVPVAGLDPSAQQYSSYTATMNLTTPDAKVTMSGCTNAGLPCSFAVSSIGGAATDDWTYLWTITGPSGFTTGSKSANPLVVNIPVSADGVYNVSVKVTKGIFDTTVTPAAVTVQPTACGPLPPASDASIVASCYDGCPANVSISLRPSFWSYSAQECDTFTWLIDGQTKVGKNVSWTPTRNTSYTIKLTVTNSSGSAPISVQQTIKVGSGPVDPPPPAECLAASTVTIATGCVSGECKSTDLVKFTAYKNGVSLQVCDAVSWEIGGATYTQKSPAVKLPAGTHTIKVTVTPSGKSPKSATSSLVVITGNTSGCNPAPGPQKFYVEYTGLTSGCTDLSDSQPCTPGETIRLKATTYFYDWQTCDRWEWDFGDGSAKGTTAQVDHVFPQTKTQWDVALRVYNTTSPEGTTIGKSVKMQAQADTKPVPVLGFQAFPSTGSKDVPIRFRVNSNLATTTGWTWTFTDTTGTDTRNVSRVSSSDEITHTFTKLGTFTVKVQARNSESTSQVLSASTQSPITITDTPEYRYLLPVVAHAGGLSDSSWRTDVQFYTPDMSVSPSNPLSLTATFQGENVPLLIGKSTYIWVDFMASLKPGVDTQGPVIITLKSKYAPQIWTRTYNQTTAGTFGQFIPAIRLDDVGAGSAMGEGDYHLAGLRGGARYRTNIGLVNPNSQPVTATLRVYDNLGVPYPVENPTRTLQPFELQQFPAPGPADKPFSIEVQVPDGFWLIAYASFIDGGSNDPVFMRAIRASELGSPDYRTIMVPGVGHVGNWRSDVTIFNPDGHSLPVDLTYHDPSGAAVATANVTVPAGGFLQYADLLKQGLFGTVPDSVGMLRLSIPNGIPADLNPMAFARTYNDDGSGRTYGQGIAGFPSNRANLRPGTASMIPGVRSNSKYYTNVGLTNVSSTTATVTVSVLDPFFGTQKSQRTFTLEPNASVVATNYCLGTPGEAGACTDAVEDGSLKLEVTGGSVWAFGSVIDKGTFDPEYVPATPLP